MKHLLCVVGPTASGKTAFAASLALELGGEVVSCDSVQIYKGFDIGSAKPTPDEMRGVPHHMLDVAEPHEVYSAGRYALEADECVRDIYLRGKIPVICGGTGLYLKALAGELADIPQCPRLDHGENAWEELSRIDPTTAARLAPGDRKRIWRALDVWKATGIPLSRYHENTPAPHYTTHCIALDGGGRESLYARIDRRAAGMLERGLIEETEALLASGVPAECPPMQSIGYRQAAAVISGRMSREEALEDIARQTRRYAKRQITWFSGQMKANWINLDKDADSVKKNVEIFMKLCYTKAEE